jgi:hypothetical protein
MSHVALRFLTTSAALAALCFASVAAQAQSVRVRCDSFPDRSKASVDGRNLVPGHQYSAVLTSGDTHSAQSPLDTAVDDELEFDFDSDRANVRAGATKIGRHFIVDNQVTGKLLDVNGNVVAKKTVECRVH